MKKKVFIVLAVVLVAALACGLLAGCADPRTDAFFTNGLMPVVNKDGYFGYVDEDGNIAIDCKYALASPFYGEYALVTYSGEEYFAIDKKGKPAGEIKLSEFDDEACQGTAIIAACDNVTGLWGFFDLNTAAWAVAPRYDEASVCGGVGKVTLGTGSKAMQGAIDPATGAELVPCEYQGSTYANDSDFLSFYTETEEGYEVTAVNTAAKTVALEKIACDKVISVAGLLLYRVSAEGADGAVTITYYIAGIEYSAQQSASGTGSELLVFSGNYLDNVFANVFKVKTVTETGSTISLLAVYGGKATVIAQDLPDNTVITTEDETADVYSFTVPGQEGAQAVTTYFDGVTGAIVTPPTNANGEVDGKFMRADDETDALYFAAETVFYALTSVAEDGSVSAAQTRLADLDDGATVESVCGGYLVMSNANTGENGVYDLSGNLVKAFAPGIDGWVTDGYIVEVEEFNSYCALYRPEDGKQIFDFSDELISEKAIELIEKIL